MGSVRAIVTPTGAVRERNDYYAFGARHVRADHPQNANRFKFNGKEEQTTGFASSDNAPFLDYGARMYDPALARWFNPDPLAESYFAHSPYHFSGNNPINLVDQNGMWYDEWIYNTLDFSLYWLSDTGGDKSQAIHFAGQNNNGDFEIFDTLTIEGNTAYAGPIGGRWGASKVNLWEGLNEGYNIT